MLDTLDKLPLPLLAFMGLGLGIMLFVRHFGVMSGEKVAPAESRTSAQVAAVIVDSTALLKAVDAVGELTKVIKEGAGDAKDHAHMISRRLDDLNEQLEDVSRAMAEMRVEMARRH